MGDGVRGRNVNRNYLSIFAATNNNRTFISKEVEYLQNVDNNKRHDIVVTGVPASAFEDREDFDMDPTQQGQEERDRIDRKNRLGHKYNTYFGEIGSVADACHKLGLDNLKALRDSVLHQYIGAVLRHEIPVNNCFNNLSLIAIQLHKYEIDQIG